MKIKRNRYSKMELIKTKQFGGETENVWTCSLEVQMPANHFSFSTYFTCTYTHKGGISVKTHDAHTPSAPCLTHSLRVVRSRSSPALMMWFRKRMEQLDQKSLLLFYKRTENMCVNPDMDS